MNMIEVESKTLVPITPRLLAESFWHLSAIEQAEFFHELHDVVSKTPPTKNRHLYGLGEMQWCYMGTAIKEYSRQSREMFLAFSAFAFDFWPQKSEL